MTEEESGYQFPTGDGVERVVAEIDVDLTLIRYVLRQVIRSVPDQQSLLMDIDATLAELLEQLSGTTPPDVVEKFSQRCEALKAFFVDQEPQPSDPYLTLVRSNKPDSEK